MYVVIYTAEELNALVACVHYFHQFPSERLYKKDSLFVHDSHLLLKGKERHVMNFNLYFVDPSAQRLWFCRNIYPTVRKSYGPAKFVQLNPFCSSYNTSRISVWKPPFKFFQTFCVNIRQCCEKCKIQSLQITSVVSYIMEVI